MTAAIAAGRRLYLPRGWRHFGSQLADLVRLSRSPTRWPAAWPTAIPSRAFANGWRVIDVEQRLRPALRADAPGLVDAVVALARDARLVDVLELGVHRRRARAALGLPPAHDAFTRFRNTILLANVIGLVGYVVAADGAAADVPGVRLRRHARHFGGLNHGSGLIQLAANPYAAMPSLHAADALIVGVVLACVCQALSRRSSGCSGRAGSGSA